MAAALLGFGLMSITTSPFPRRNQVYRVMAAYKRAGRR